MYANWVTSADVPSNQTAFGGHIAQVSRSQIFEFIADNYKTKDSQAADPTINDFLTYIEKLDANRVYGLASTQW